MEVEDRLQGGEDGPKGALGWTGVPRGANGRVHEANILGTVMGCYGANLLLCDINVFHDRIYIFHKNIKRAFV